MNIESLETEKVSAYWDEVVHVARVTYRGMLTPDVTIAFYKWVAVVAAYLIPNKLPARGVIFDFRQVTDFSSANLSTAQRESRDINAQYDTSQVASAFIINNLYQERMLYTYFKITADEDRKRIVKSEEEALAFIDEWHRKSESVEQEAVEQSEVAEQEAVEQEPVVQEIVVQPEADNVPE